MGTTSTAGPAPKKPPVRWRWLILLSRSLIAFVCLGLFKAMGVFLPHFVRDLRTTESAVGISVGVYGALCDILAPIASALISLGRRNLIIFGGAVMGAATVVAATSPSVPWLAWWLALASAGETFLHVCSIGPMMDYFPDSFASAMGASFTVGTVGMMTVPLLAEILIERFGWRGALCLLGALNLNLVACGALMRDRGPPRYQRIEDLDETGVDLPDTAPIDDRGDGHDGGEKCCGVQGSLSPRERFECLSRPIWTISPLLPRLLACSCVGALYTSWQVFLAPHAVALGYSGRAAASLSTLGGLGSLLGRGVGGPLTDKLSVAPSTQMTLASALVGASCVLDPLAAGSYAGLAALAFFTGLGIGVSYPLTLIIMREGLAEDQHMTAFGLVYFFLGGGQVLGGYLAGWLYGVTGDYAVTFIAMGCVSFAVVPLLVSTRIVELFRVRCSRE